MGDRGLTRRHFLAAGAAVAATGLEPASVAEAARRRPPNVVLILADDLGYGMVGAYGQRTLRTPNLDRLADEGARFTNGYAPAPMCAPSRCCLLTGMHNGHARVRDNSFTETGEQPRLEPEDVTVGQVLKAAGYQTGIFGKWGFGDDAAVPRTDVGAGVCTGGRHDHPVPEATEPDASHPLQKGFDEFVGLITHNHSTEGYYPDYVWDGNARTKLPENDGEQRGTYAPELYLRRALDFVERHRRRPFFCLLTPQLVHWPALVPSTEPYAGRRDWTEDQKATAAQVTLLDAYVGRVRRTLERLGLDRNTLVLFSSDNGPTPEERTAFGSGRCTDQTGPAPDAALAESEWAATGGLRGTKHSLYEGGIRVPLIAWGPGVLRRDGLAPVDRPWSASDLLPTLADLAGVSAPSDVDGVSIRPWLTGERRGPVRHPPLYWERPPYIGYSRDGSPPVPTTYAQAVRDKAWKLVRYAPGRSPDAPDDEWTVELYDLANDRSETHDMAQAAPDVTARLLGLIRAAHAPQPYARAPYTPRRLKTGFDTRPRRKRKRRA
jgi:arylsulfatase A